MTPEQVRKDREAGTQGEWVLTIDPNGMISNDEVLYRIGSEDDPIMHNETYYSKVPENERDWHRIARLPKLEAFYLSHHDAPSRIEALEAELVADDRWQTMETAPKDGTELVCWVWEMVGRSIRGRILMLSWFRYNGEEAWFGDDMVSREPTHWQLPGPPQEIER